MRRAFVAGQKIECRAANKYPRIDVLRRSALACLLWLETLDVGDLSTLPDSRALPAGIFHREVFTSSTLVGLRLHDFPANSLSQHFLAGSLRHPHQAVDRAAHLACRERPGGMGAAEIRPSRCPRPGAATHHAGSDTPSPQRPCRRGPAGPQRDCSHHGRRHSLPLGLFGAATPGLRQVQFLSAAHPGGLSHLFLRRWYSAAGLVHPLVAVCFGREDTCLP